MRVLSLLMFSTLAASFAYGQSRVPKISMWIWSDKYTYKPGDPVTLRWTVKANGDDYPYTVFVYRQNNQTGKKFYMPGRTETPVDINGTVVGDTFTSAPLEDVTKGVLIGDDGKFPSFSIPDSELGMQTFVVQLRDSDGREVFKTSYMKFGVVSER